MHTTSAWKVLVALVAVAVGPGAVPGGWLAADPPEPRTDFAGDPLPANALLRLGTVRHRYLYTSPLGGNQRLPDGKSALTGTAGEVHRVDLATGRLTDSWPLPQGHRVCGFSPDGRLAVLRNQRAFRLWDLAARKLVKEFPADGDQALRVEVRFAPDGRHFATDTGDPRRPLPRAAGRPAPVRVWNVANSREVWHSGEDNRARGQLTLLGFVDNDTVAVLEPARQHRVSLRDVATGREQRSFAPASLGVPRGVYLSPDGKTLLVGTTGKARAWNVATGEELPPLDGHQGDVTRFALGGDGKTVLTGGDDPFVLVRDWPGGKPRARIELGAGRSAFHLDVSVDGKRAEVVCLNERALRLFDLESGKELPQPAEGHRGQVTGVTITPDGKVVSAARDNTVRVWDLATGKALHVHELEHRDGPSAFAVSADGLRVATAAFRQGAVTLRDRDTGRPVRTINSGGLVVTSAALGPKDSLALTALADAPGTGGLRYFWAVWDVNAGRESRHSQGTPSQGELVFSPDGRRIALFEGEQVKLVELAGERERTLGMQPGVQGLAFSADGRTLACGRGYSIALWELASGKERGRIRTSWQWTSALRFSPDGRWLACAGSSGRDGGYGAVHLWDARRDQMLPPLTGHEGLVSGLAFAPDARTLASCSLDTTVLIWDTAALAARQPPPMPGSAADVAAAWTDLASADAKVAYRAVLLLAATPALGVPLLRERLHPAPLADKKQVERWLAALDSDKFDEREEATRQLRRQGPHVEATLNALLAGNPSAEAGRRVKDLLAEVGGPVDDPEQLRAIRAVEALEGMRTADARDLLGALAKSNPETVVTQDAATALRRLSRGR